MLIAHCLDIFLRERIRKEIFKGTEIKGAHRSGSEGAAAVILGYAAVAYSLFTLDANPFTGFLLGQPWWHLLMFISFLLYYLFKKES
jgi:hypothetical protein